MIKRPRRRRIQPRDRVVTSNDLQMKPLFSDGATIARKPWRACRGAIAVIDSRGA